MISYAHPLISSHAGAWERFLKLPTLTLPIESIHQLDPCWHVVFYPAAQEGGSIFEAEGDQLKLKGEKNSCHPNIRHFTSFYLVLQVARLLLQQLLPLLASQLCFS